MKQTKFRAFVAQLGDGAKVEFKLPKSVTESYIIRDAWHYINKLHGTKYVQGDVVSVKGIITF